MTEAQAARGRPPKPDHLQLRNRVVILLSDADLAELDHIVAESSGTGRSDFCRDAIVNAVRRYISKEGGE